MRPELATLITESKKTGIYERFVKDSEKEFGDSAPDVLIQHIKDLLKLHQTHFIFRADVQDALLRPKYKGSGTSLAFAFAFVTEHQPLLPEHVALIKSSQTPEETAEVIVTLTRCRRPDLIPLCIQLAGPALSAETIEKLAEKGLLTDKILAHIARHSKNDDSFIKMLSLYLQADCLNERRLYQLQSAPNDYLSSVRWTLTNIRDLVFHYEAAAVFDWFFPPRPLASLPGDFFKSMFWQIPPATRSDAEIERVANILHKLQTTTLSPTYLFKEQYEWLLSDEAQDWLWQYLPVYGIKEERDGLIASLLALLNASKNPNPEDIYRLLTTYLESEKRTIESRRSIPVFSQGEYADFLDNHPEVTIPDRFTCLITRNIITNPMTDNGKQFYEAGALTHQIATLHKHPFNGTPASIEQFYPASELKAKIDAFMREVAESLPSVRASM